MDVAYWTGSSYNQKSYVDSLTKICIDEEMLITYLTQIDVLAGLMDEEIEYEVIFKESFTKTSLILHGNDVNVRYLYLIIHIRPETNKITHIFLEDIEVMGCDMEFEQKDLEAAFKLFLEWM